jgi:hypothetical protein
MVVGELHELGIALGCRLDGNLVEDTTSRSINHGCGVGMDVSVDADDGRRPLADWSNCSCVLSFAGRDVVPVRDGGSAGL